MADTSTLRRQPVLTALVVVALAVAGVLVAISRNGSAAVAGSTPTVSTAASPANTASPTNAATTRSPTMPSSSTAATTPGPATSGVPQRPPPAAGTHSPTGTPQHVGTGATVPVQPVRTSAPVPLDGTGDFGTGVTLRLSRITAVEGRATAPGEVAAPAISFTVTAHNARGSAAVLDSVQVLVTYGKDRAPASALRQGTSPLRGALASGATATGTYTFTVPRDHRDDVRVEISYSTTTPTVAFQGSVG